MGRGRRPACWLGLALGCLAFLLLTELLLLLREGPSDPFWGCSSSTGQREPELDHWQNVSTNPKFYVYSAYYDGRMSPAVVRVVAAARTRQPQLVKCMFWFESEPVVEVPAKNKIIRENWGLNYSAYFVLCPAKGLRPTMVSVLPLDQTKATNVLRVHYNQGSIHEPKMLALCVKPVHNHYNQTNLLLEFLELNRILGVQHFYIYNHTMSPEVTRLLTQYQRGNQVTVLMWNLDIPSQKEIRTEGLFAAFNDCLYRTMYKFRFVMMIDLDEYIIPYKHPSLRDLLVHLVRLTPNNRTGGFSFQNSFFYLHWPDDPLSEQTPFPLVTLQKTTRKSEYNPHGKRSKCIVLPERVIEIGNHLVWEFIPDFKIMRVSPVLSFLHHYRTCEFGGVTCTQVASTRDRRTFIWKERLTKEVSLRLSWLRS